MTTRCTALRKHLEFAAADFAEAKRWIRIRTPYAREMAAKRLREAIAWRDSYR